mmetsp:Transcript_66581/g.110704  ORF Transcript_66581/g.110704 Transcript_66581/m.110704 type:complete len:93 (-) Transcript_66581:359-637(-)
MKRHAKSMKAYRPNEVSSSYEYRRAMLRMPPSCFILLTLKQMQQRGHTVAPDIAVLPECVAHFAPAASNARRPSCSSLRRQCFGFYHNHRRA